MTVFAWILWCYTLLSLILVVIVIIAKNIKGEKYQFNFGTLALTIATFVFMTIYLFAR